MSVALPRSFNLAEPLNSLPDNATSQLVTCRPVSGNTFSPSSTCTFFLGNRGWLNPESLYIRYKASIVAGDVSGSFMIGAPVYTPFQRVQIMANGASLDSINGYNMVAHVITNTKKDVAQKYGLLSSYGYTNTSFVTSTGLMEFVDGRYDPSGSPATYTVAAPLVGTVLTNSTKQIPLFCTPQISIELTLDSIVNMFTTTPNELTYAAAALPTSFTISNFELCYQMTDLGAAVEAGVMNMGRQLSIKSHGFSNTATACPTGTNGSQSYVFNQRFNSIKAAFICPTAAAGSKWAEIVDVTGGAGQYSLLCGQTQFPQAPLSSVNNRSGILCETQRAASNLYDNNGAMSINTKEFNVNLGATYVWSAPGKFIVGVGLSKLGAAERDTSFAGQSTYNTPLSVNIDFNGATASSASINLILNYDAILVVDPVARQLSVRS